MQLGSTVTVMIIFPDGRLAMAHVGDSRLYRMTDSEITQLTEDQTFVAREIAAGRMTPEEAENDPRKNVLLQCVGAYGENSAAVFDKRSKGGESYLYALTVSDTRSAKMRCAGFSLRVSAFQRIKCARGLQS